MYDIIGKTILLNGRKLVAVNHNKTNKIIEFLILKNKSKDEIPEGSRMKLTEEYLKKSSFSVIED